MMKSRIRPGFVLVAAAASAANTGEPGGPGTATSNVGSNTAGPGTMTPTPIRPSPVSASTVLNAASRQTWTTTVSDTSPILMPTAWLPPAFADDLNVLSKTQIPWAFPGYTAAPTFTLDTQKRILNCVEYPSPTPTRPGDTVTPTTTVTECPKPANEDTDKDNAVYAMWGWDSTENKTISEMHFFFNNASSPLAQGGMDASCGGTMSGYGWQCHVESTTITDDGESVATWWYYPRVQGQNTMFAEMVFVHQNLDSGGAQIVTSGVTILLALVAFVWSFA